MAQIRLLIADDDGVILAIFGEGLRKVGYEVIEVNSGEAALKVAVEKQIDLVILDVDMPGMSGIDTACKMKELNVPVVFLSAHDCSKIVEAAAAEGALSYVVKPIDVAKLIPTIKVALKRAEDLQELKNTEGRLISALDTGKMVNVVIGIIMERDRITRDEAFELLRRNARSKQCKVRDVAMDMINALETLNQLTPGRSPAGGSRR